MNIKANASLPELDQLDRNFVNVTLPGLSLYFSYQTLVSFAKDGELYVSENIWSKTTGKHLNRLCDDHSKRLPHSEFLKKWEELTNI